MKLEIPIPKPLTEERAMKALESALEMADGQVSQSGGQEADDIRAMAKVFGVDYRNASMRFLKAAGFKMG